MGNCLAKSRVNPKAHTSTGKRSTNGGWRRKLMKRLRLGKHTARVDVGPVEETDNEDSSDSIDDTDRKVSEIDKDDCIRQKQESKEIEKTGSVLVLFYAREEKADDNTSGTPRSPLAISRTSPFFSSEESLYEGFEDTSTDIEQEIEEEINPEDDLETLSIDNKVEEENTQARDQTSANDETSANFTEPKPVCAPTTQILPKCHFYASCEADDVDDEEIPEEISLEEDDSETNLNNVRLCNRAGTGNVSIDNDIAERAIHKMQLLKSGLKVPETLFKDKKSNQALSSKKNAKLNYSKDFTNIASSEVINGPGVSEPRLTYDEEKRAPDVIDSVPRNDKFAKKRESSSIVIAGEEKESEVSDPRLKYDKEKQSSNSKDIAQRNDKFTKKRESSDIVIAGEKNESEVSVPKLKYDIDKQASSIIGNAPRNDILPPKRDFPDIVTTKELNEFDVPEPRLNYDKEKDKLTQKRECAIIVTTEAAYESEVSESILTNDKEKQASSTKDRAPRDDKFARKRESQDIVTSDGAKESEVLDSRLNDCDKEIQAPSIDIAPRNDKFSKKSESSDTVTIEEANESKVPCPRRTCDKEKQASSTKDNAPRNDTFTDKGEPTNVVTTKVSSISEVPASRLTYEQEKHASSAIDNGPGKDKVINKREFSNIASSEKPNESPQLTRTDKTCEVLNETQSMPAFTIVSPSADKQCVANEELKSKIALTVMNSLEKIKRHKARADCSLNIYVRSAKPDWEPRQIQVRATSNQVKDGAARIFVKSLGNVADPVSHFDPFDQRNKQIKRHVNKNSSLALADNTTAAKWVQKQGKISDVSLTKVPQFYEPPPKKQNAREKLGLENLQKYKIKVQCKEIERIKIGEEQFPGILPPKLMEQWKKKKEEKKLTN